MDIGNLDPARLSLVAHASSPTSPLDRPENQTLIRAVEAVNKSGLMGESQELVFTFDRKLRKPILRIVDKETGELIQQIPQEYLLRLAEQAREK